MVCSSVHGNLSHKAAPDQLDLFFVPSIWVFLSNIYYFKIQTTIYNTYLYIYIIYVNIHTFIHTHIPQAWSHASCWEQVVGFLRSYGYKLYPTDFFVHVEVTWLLFASISHESVRLQTASLCESWTWHAMVSDRRFGVSSDEFSRTTQFFRC